MATHLSGGVIWDVLFDVARAGRRAVMPVGCPVAVIDQEAATYVPASLAESVGVSIVSSGDDLQRLVQG